MKPQPPSEKALDTMRTVALATGAVTGIIVAYGAAQSGQYQQAAETVAGVIAAAVAIKEQGGRK